MAPGALPPPTPSSPAPRAPPPNRRWPSPAPTRCWPRARSCSPTPTRSSPPGTTPIKRDPFEVPLDTKIGFLMKLNETAIGVQGVSFVNSQILFVDEQKYFASRKARASRSGWCARIRNSRPPPPNRASGDFQTRPVVDRAKLLGYEYVEDYPWLQDAEKAGHEVVEKLKSKPVAAGRYDIVVDPSQLFLAIHESVGHSTELDRSLGYEANMAGTSLPSASRSTSTSQPSASTPSWASATQGAPTVRAASASSSIGVAPGSRQHVAATLPRRWQVARAVNVSSTRPSRSGPDDGDLRRHPGRARRPPRARRRRRAAGARPASTDRSRRSASTASGCGSGTRARGVELRSRSRRRAATSATTPADSRAASPSPIGGGGESPAGPRRRRGRATAARARRSVAGGRGRRVRGRRGGRDHGGDGGRGGGAGVSTGRGASSGRAPGAVVDRCRRRCLDRRRHGRLPQRWRRPGGREGEAAHRRRSGSGPR